MTDEPLHGRRRFAELADVDVVERRRLRELAVADPALAEEELAGMLCRSRTTVIRRYIREVLMGVADHADWTRENARMPSEAEALASLIGRAPSVEEAVGRHRYRGNRACTNRAASRVAGRDHGLAVAARYLAFVTGELARAQGIDYLDCVSSGQMSHADWVEKRLPMLRNR
jgi:hypothetical protein